MNTSRISILKSILIFGLILGMLIISINTFLYLQDSLIDRSSFFSILTTVLILLITVLGIYFFKRKNNSIISLGQALKVGVGISLFGGLLFITWYILLVNVFDPDFTNKIEANELRQLAEESLTITEEQIEKKQESTQKITSSFIIFAINIFEHLFYGFVISLIAGLILQKKEEPHIE